MTTDSTRRPWRAPAAIDARTIAAYAAATKTAPVTAEILMRRGYRTAAEAARFLNPSVADVGRPLDMKGMAVAADRVKRAIVGREPILIYHDYDADGIPGAALLVNWMRSNGAIVSTMSPRRDEGYGLSMARAKRIATMTPKPRLVITVDLGSSDHDAVTYLRSQAIDVLVTDHHLTLKGAPPTPYFINPSRSDGETYPYKPLCGCGVAYKLVQAMSSRLHEPKLYDLVALSTVADQVPVTGENRFYVKAALQILNAGMGEGNIGIRALTNVAGERFDRLDATDIGWKIAPRINAVGRMGADPELVIELLTTSDHNRAMALAADMNKLNSERQTLTNGLYKAALEQVGNNPDDLIVVYLAEATVGVAGLVAAKVVQEYGHPTLVVNPEGRGSGRAPDGGAIMPYMEQLRAMGVFGSPRRTNLGEVVTPDYGGHSGACGFHNVDVATLRSAAKRIKTDALSHEGAHRIEAVTTLAGITLQAAADEARLQPFGNGNPEPCVMIRNVAVADSAQSKDKRALFLTLVDGEESRRGYFFGAGDLFGSVPSRVDVLGFPTMGMTGNPEFRITSLRAAVR